MSTVADCVTDFIEQISETLGRRNEDGEFQKLLQKRRRWSDARLIDDDPADYYKVLPIQLAKPFNLNSNDTKGANADSISKLHNQRVDRNAKIIQSGGTPPFPLYKKIAPKAKDKDKDTDSGDNSSKGSSVKGAKKGNKDNLQEPNIFRQPPKSFKGSWFVQECVAIGNVHKDSAFLEITKIISGAVVAGQVVTGMGITDNTKIRNQLKSSDGEKLSFFLTEAQEEAAEDVELKFTGTILRVKDNRLCAILQGQKIMGKGIPKGTVILTENLLEVVGLSEANKAEQTDNDVDTEQDDNSSSRGLHVGPCVKSANIIPSNQNVNSGNDENIGGYLALSIPLNMEMQPADCCKEIDIRIDGSRPDDVELGNIFTNKGLEIEERYDGVTRVVKSKRDGKGGYKYDYHCRHGKRKYRCKECGESAFCFHGKERHRCEDCCGSKIKEKMLKKQWEDNDPNALMDGIDGGGDDSCIVNQSLFKTDADPMPGEPGYQPSANSLANSKGVTLIFDWNTFTWESRKNRVGTEEQTSVNASNEK